MSSKQSKRRKTRDFVQQMAISTSLKDPYCRMDQKMVDLPATVTICKVSNNARWFI